MNDLKILIIQNTWYHFETTISLYKSLLRLSPKKVSVTQLDLRESKHQFEFCVINNIDYLHRFDYSIFDYDVAFIISAYPNPYVPLHQSIPHENSEIIQHYKNKTIYLCHRFDDETYFTNHAIINHSNSLCLSPLSSKINIDFWYPIEYNLEPTPYQHHLNKICIQGHFEHGSRENFSELIHKCRPNYTALFIGTGLYTFNSSCVKSKNGLTEIKFYDEINNSKYIFAAITPTTKNGTYTYQRFSSNFNHAAALEKPLFCHEFFQDIYEIPGIYYNDANINDKFNELLNTNLISYKQLVNDFRPFKSKYSAHNTTVLKKKISQVLV